MPPTRGNVVAILSNSGKANPRAFAEERLGVLASNHKSAGDDAAALRCEIIVPEGSHGGGWDPQPNTHVITLHLFIQPLFDKQIFRNLGTIFILRK